MNSVCAIFPYKLGSDSGHKIRARNVIELFKKANYCVSIIEPEKDYSGGNKFIFYLKSWAEVFKKYLKEREKRKCIFIYNRGIIPFPLTLLLKLMGKKIIFDLPIDHTPKGYFLKRKNMRNLINYIDFKLSSFLITFDFVENDIIFRNHVVEGVERTKVKIVPHCVDIEKFSNIVRKNKPQVNCIFVGQLSIVDKINIILEMMEEIVKSNSNIILYIIGCGTYYEEYNEKIMRSGLQNKIILKGIMEHDDVIRFLKNMDIALFTQDSINATKIPEYMAAGIPIVSFSRNAFLITDSDCGLLSDNWKDYKDNIIKLVNSHELRIKMGNAGRRYIENNLTHKIISDKLRYILSSTV